MIDQKAINQQFERLIVETDKYDDEQVLKVSDNLLGKIPNDQDVQLCKVVSQLRLSKFDNLESYFPKNPSTQDGPETIYAYAYYLYKKAKYDDCLALIKKVNFPDPDKKSFTLLEAQVKFKKGDFHDAAKIYLSVLEDADVDIDNTEAMTNLFNCLTQIPRDQTNLVEKVLQLTKKYLSQNEEDLVREFFYNLALLYTNLGNYNQSKNYLEKFKQSIDLSDSEGQQDLLMYEIQSDYIDSFLFNLSAEETEARFQRYAEKLELDVSDYYKIALKNNMINYKDRSKELGDSIKKIDEILKLSQKAELTPQQVFDLKVNKLILYLVKNKYSESTKLIEEIEKNYQPSEYLANEKFVSCKYFLLFRTKKFKEVESLNQFLLSQLDKLSSSSRVPILLVNGEINRLFGNQKALVDNLIRILNVDKSYASNNALSALIINTLSKNLNLLGDFQGIIQTVQSQSDDPSVISQIAELYIKDKDYKQAIKLYEQVLQRDKENIRALERLGYLYSFTDMKKAEEYLQRIPQVDFISDLNELRRLEVDYLPSRGTKVEESKTILEASKKIKKRKRKPRYPKGFDPENPGRLPDPERWLPKMERAKNKKLAKKKGLGRGTQGVSTGAETMQTFHKSVAPLQNESVSKPKKAQKKRR